MKNSVRSRLLKYLVLHTWSSETRQSKYRINIVTRPKFQSISIATTNGFPHTLEMKPTTALWKSVSELTWTSKINFNSVRRGDLEILTKKNWLFALANQNYKKWEQCRLGETKKDVCTRHSKTFQMHKCETALTKGTFSRKNLTEEICPCENVPGNCVRAKCKPQKTHHNNLRQQSSEVKRHDQTAETR